MAFVVAGGRLRNATPVIRSGGALRQTGVQILPRQPYGPKRKTWWPHKWKGPPGLPRWPLLVAGGRNGRYKPLYFGAA